MEDYDSVLGVVTNSEYLYQKLNVKFTEKYLKVVKIRNHKDVVSKKIDYLVLDLRNDKLSKEEVLEITSTFNGKIIFLSPYYCHDHGKAVWNKYLDRIDEIAKNYSVLFIPELVGEGAETGDDSLSFMLINQSLIADRIKVPDLNQEFFIVNYNELVKEIVKQTLSFGLQGKKMLVGMRTNIKEFLTLGLNIKSENIINTNIKVDLGEMKTDLTKNVKISISKNVARTKEKIKDLNLSRVRRVDNKSDSILEPIKVNKEVSNSHNNVSKIKTLIPKIFVTLIFGLLLFLVPGIMLLASVGLMYYSLNGVFTNPSKSIRLASAASNISTTVAEISLGVPIYVESANIINRSAKLFTQAVSQVDTVKKIAIGINNEEPYDINSLSQELSAGLDKIYTDFSFLQSDIDEFPGLLGKELRYFLNSNKADIGFYKQKIYSLKKISSRLPNLLGFEKPKKYLIVFQNNMELRPTGGFIGSFALITFSKGKLTEMVVNDVYSADGQLNGHVEPPEPIKRYLGEGGWYLRDSNWDPEFSKSAEKIEWFLDKEIDQKVDGVVGIDLYLIQDLLRVTGPISLSDFGITITPENLYSTTQSEVEESFFPGSIKKASFLTSLSRLLINEMENLKEDKYSKLFKVFYENLEAKHIQMYLHDLNSQEAIKELGYAGQVKLEGECGERCFVDKYMYLDANLGVNKSNYFINRSQEVSVTPKTNEVGHKLTVAYANSAGYSLGPSGIYKTYSRLLIPSGSTFGKVTLIEQSGQEKNIDTDVVERGNYKEVGFWLEVQPQSIVKLNLDWSVPTEKLTLGGELRFSVIKQAGTGSDIFRLNVETTNLSLTGRVPSSYNSSLVRDYSQKLFFKP